MYCTKCGSQAAGEQRFCAACGTALTLQKPPLAGGGGGGGGGDSWMVIGACSVVAIVAGLTFQKELGHDLAVFLVIGGAILGSLNVLITVINWFRN